MTTGKVSRISEYGCQLNGEDVWYKYSKYAKSLQKLQRSDVGQVVTLTLNKAHFIEEIMKADAFIDTSAGKPEAECSTSNSQQLIIRQTCIKAACDLCKIDINDLAKVDANVQTVKSIAKEFEAYIMEGSK